MSRRRSAASSDWCSRPHLIRLVLPPALVFLFVALGPPLFHDGPDPSLTMSVRCNNESTHSSGKISTSTPPSTVACWRRT